KALGLKDREIGRDLADTSIVTLATSLLLGPAIRTSQGRNQADTRKKLSAFADRVLSGKDGELARYEQIRDDAKSLPEARFADDKVEHLKNRAHWIKQTLGETEGVDPARAKQFAVMVEAVAKREAVVGGK